MKNTRTLEGPSEGGCSRLDSSVERTILSIESGAAPSPLDTLPTHWICWWGCRFPARLSGAGV